MDDLWTSVEIAEAIGVKPMSARMFHQQAERRRREGTSRPSDMPPPDRVIGRTPVWNAETIKPWIANRRTRNQTPQSDLPQPTDATQTA